MCVEPKWNSFRYHENTTLLAYDGDLEVEIDKVPWLILFSIFFPLYNILQYHRIGVNQVIFQKWLCFPRSHVSQNKGSCSQFINVELL